MPLLYGVFAKHFNSDKNSCNGAVQFPLMADDGSCCTTSRVSPTLQDVLRDTKARWRKEEEQEKKARDRVIRE